jgi:hypothetical protein
MTTTLNDDGRPFEAVDPDENDYENWNAQTEAMVRSTENGQLIAIERGVTHGAAYTVTRFASPIAEVYEPLEYHYTTDDLTNAADMVEEVAEQIAEGEIDQ